MIVNGFLFFLTCLFSKAFYFSKVSHSWFFKIYIYTLLLMQGSNNNYFSFCVCMFQSDYNCKEENRKKK